MPATRPEPFRHVALPPPAVPLLAPDGDADLVLAAYALGDDGRYLHVHVTDVVREADLAFAWRGLEVAYTFSGATFALLQRLGLRGPQVDLRRLDAEPASARAFDATIPFYTHERATLDGGLLALTFDEAMTLVSIERVADDRALHRALARAGSGVCLAVRCIATVTWHIHM